MSDFERGRRIPDMDEREEAHEQRHRRRSMMSRCQCAGGEEMPGRCPGPENCPMVDHGARQ